MMGNIPLSMEITLLSEGLSIKLILIQQLIDCMSNHFAIYTPNDTKNESGQHLEHAPFVSVILPTSWRLMMKRAIFLSKFKRRNDA
jgi:hypothetical protein